MTKKTSILPSSGKFSFAFIPFLLCSLILFSCSVYAQELDPAYERALARAALKIENADYEGAAEDAREALRIKNDDEKATLYLGIALSRSGSAEAENILKRALSQNPQNPRTNLELGIYYYNKGIYEESEDYFGTAIQAAPETEIALKSREYLENIRKGGTVKPWSLDISLGGQYDTNVILEDGDSLPQGISDKADWRAVFLLRGKYHFLRREKVEGALGYSFYQSLHANLPDFNVTNNLPEFTMAFHLAPWVSLKARYAFDYTLVGGDAYSYSHIVSPAVVFSLWKGLTTTVEYKYRKNHFMDTDLFGDNSDRRGFNNSIAVTETIPVASFGSIRVGYANDNENTRAQYWSYSGNKYFAGIRWNLPVRFYLDLYGEYHNRNYRERYPSAPRLRQDIMKSVSGSLTRVFSDRFSISVGQLYTRNKSSVDLFDYERAITSLFFTVRF
ncbi:MAG: tetratricopeptide repeat protein [Nitrospirota bacterium]